MKTFICAGLAMALAAPAVAHAQTVTYEWDRASNQGNAGYAAGVLNIGDFNGDGWQDVAVTAGGWVLPNASIRQGAVFIYLGTAGGLPPATQPANYILTSDLIQGGGFGSAIAAGDMNGDGLSDLVIGGMYAETRGAVYAFYGRAGTPMCSAQPNTGCTTLTPAWKRVGPTAALYYGEAVALADVNCDMVDDVIVSTHWWGDGVTPHIGLVDVFYSRRSPSGAPGVVIAPDATPNWSDTSHEYLSEYGWSLAAGDFTGDYDVVTPTEPSVDANHDSYPEYGTPDLDLDGDGVNETQGCEDFVVGAPRYGWYNAYRGRVYHYMGSADGPLLSGTYTHTVDQARYGEKLTTVGDVNRDGRVDYVVHNRLADDNTTMVDAGQAFLVRGGAFGQGNSLIHNAQAGSRFGAGVGSIGLFNPDACLDFAVGQEGFDSGSPGTTIADTGAINLYFGTGANCVSDGDLYAPDRIWVSNQYGLGLGAAVGNGATSAGPANARVLMGMPSYDTPTGVNVGRATTARY